MTAGAPRLREDVRQGLVLVAVLSACWAVLFGFIPSHTGSPVYLWLTFHPLARLAAAALAASAVAAALIALATNKAMFARAAFSHLALLHLAVAGSSALATLEGRVSATPAVLVWGGYIAVVYIWLGGSTLYDVVGLEHIEDAE